MSKSVYCRCKDTYSVNCDCDKFPEYWKQGIGDLNNNTTPPYVDPNTFLVIMDIVDGDVFPHNQGSLTLTSILSGNSFDVSFTDNQGSFFIDYDVDGNLWDASDLICTSTRTLRLNKLPATLLYNVGSGDDEDYGSLGIFLSEDR